MDPVILKQCLPQDTLVLIEEYYTGLVNNMAAKIQLTFAAYKRWWCEDCGTPHPKHRLRKVVACDDPWGCCFKYVCPGSCVFFCAEGHPVYNWCIKYFDDIPDDYGYDGQPELYEYHKQYTSHTQACSKCGSDVWISRQFTFDLWDRYQALYERGTLLSTYIE